MINRKHFQLFLSVVFVVFCRGTESKDVWLSQDKVILRYRRFSSKSDCFADVQQRPDGFPGYLALGYENVHARFLKFNSTYHIARVTWVIPQVNNAPSGNTTTTITVGNAGSTYHWCIVVRNKTTTDIRPSDGWRFDEKLTLGVFPHPPREKMVAPLLQFVPDYEQVNVTGTNNNSSPSELLQSGKPKRDDTKILVGGVVGGAMGLTLIIVLVICQIKKPKPETPAPIPREEFYYVSFFPESKAVVKKVEDFVRWSRENSFDVQMDGMLNEVNTQRLKELGPFRFVEVVLPRARNIVMVISPAYLRLCRIYMDECDTQKINTESLSQDEKIIFCQITHIRQDLCMKMFRGDRFIPLLLNGIKEQQLPFWMQDLVLYSWPEDADKLLLRLHNLPEYAPESHCEKNTCNGDRSRPLSSSHCNIL